MNFAGAAVFGVNAADFRLENEADFGLAGFGNVFLDGGGEGIFEFIEAGFRGFEFSAEFVKPTGMGEVGGGDELDTFELSPFEEVFEVHLAAGGSGEFRVDMEVSNVEHGRMVREFWQKLYFRGFFIVGGWFYLSKKENFTLTILKNHI